MDFLTNILRALFGGTTATTKPATTSTPATAPKEPIRIAVKPTTFLDQLRKDLQVLPNSPQVTRAQVERIAQEMQRRYFPNVDWRMIVVMAWIESSFNPNAYRFESHLDDASYGLLQTLLKNNALWMFQNKGATGMGRPDAQTLRDPIVSIYFGMAYVNWLRTHPSGRNTPEWIVRAYNGGPGWNGKPASRAMTLNHWNKYQTTRRAFYG